MQEILFEARRNRITFCKSISFELFARIDESELNKILRQSSIDHISHVIASRLKFDEEMGDKWQRNFTSSIYAFTEDELLRLMQNTRNPLFTTPSMYHTIHVRGQK